jgi:hypothetical protein
LRSARDQHEDCVVGSDLRFSFQVLRAEDGQLFSIEQTVENGKIIGISPINIIQFLGNGLGNLLDNPEHHFFLMSW